MTATHKKNLREDRGIGLTPDGDKKLLNSKYVLVSFQAGYALTLQFPSPLQSLVAIYFIQSEGKGQGSSETLGKEQEH